MQDTRDERVTTWSFAPGSQRLPLIIAHRGDLSRAPENTLPAFQRAWEAGADGVELDVRLTRDGRLVVFHDRNLDRTSNGTGPVNHCTLADIRSLDVGSWFAPEFNGETAPTLDEVFESLPRDYLINVEMKVVVTGMKHIARLWLKPSGATRAGTARWWPVSTPWPFITCGGWNPEFPGDTSGLSGTPFLYGPGASARWYPPIGTTRPTIPITGNCTEGSSVGECGRWRGTWTSAGTSRPWRPCAWKRPSPIA